jgi:hypothetical protein
MEGKLIQGTSQSPSPSQTQNPQNDETSNNTDIIREVHTFAFKVLMAGLLISFLYLLLDVVDRFCCRKKEE